MSYRILSMTLETIYDQNYQLKPLMTGEYLKMTHKRVNLSLDNRFHTKDLVRLIGLDYDTYPIGSNSTNW